MTLRSSSRLPEAARSTPEPAGGAEQPEERAMAVALKALGRRALTAKEIERRLEARGFDQGVIETVVARLVEAGGIDDTSYARLFTEDKRALEGWGSERIRAALDEHGVPSRLIDAALFDVTHDGEIERAVELLRRRGEPVDGEAARGRAYGFLVRRGYESEVAYDAIRRAGPVD